MSGPARRWGARSWLALVFAFLYIPILCLVAFSFTSGEITTQFDGFSLRWYEALLEDREIQSAVWLSLRIGAMAATAAVVVGSAAAFVLTRYRPYFGSSFFAGMTTAPMVMPEVVTGLSLVLLFTHPALSFLGGRGALAIWTAHTTLCAAYATVLVQSRLREVDRSLEEAALDLGCPPFKVFFAVTVPVITPALISAWLLTFTLSMDDFVLAAMLSDPGSTTLPVLIFARLHHGLKPEINALASIIVVVVSVAVLSANHMMLSSQRSRMRARELAHN
ncbi:MAG: ABC transporter permease subunit [Azoarcus sp.]|jgi:putrescine transport system permease protein|nr:ABC transporter permease subunit [Azoarcus sp.]